MTPRAQKRSVFAFWKTFREPEPLIRSGSFRKVAAPNVIICRLGHQLQEREDEQGSEDSAPQSLAAVIAAVAKGTSGKARREQ